MTELADLRSLVDQVLDDPMGTITRLLEQVVVELLGDEDGARAVVGRMVGLLGGGTSDDTLQQTLIGKNTVVASALGACDCWGELADCPVCAGAGASGWLVPDPAAFSAYVAPAIDAMKGTEND